MEVAEFLSAKNFPACGRAFFGRGSESDQLWIHVIPLATTKMAAGNAKGGFAHRNKSVPKKTDAKSLKRKRGQEDLGKLKAAIEELVSFLFCLVQLLLGL